MTTKKNHDESSAASFETPTISPVIGEGAQAHRLVRVGGWSFTAQVGDDEPRIRDLDLAERLGYARPRDIRKLIKDLSTAGKINDINICDEQAREFGQRPAREFWLTEAQALKVIAKSETAKADEILDEVIRVYMLARRGLLGARPANDVEIARAVDAAMERRMESIAMSMLAQSKRADAIEASIVKLGGAISELASVIASGQRAPTTSDAPGIGATGAAKILGTLRSIAATKAGSIGQGGNAKVKNRIRFIEERSLRRELRYPMDRGCSWGKITEEQFGRAMLILERMTAEADDIARLAAKDAGPLFRAVPKAV